MRVLIVEDDPKMAALLARGLREEGDVVDATARAEDALWMAASTPYDAVVLDAMQPGMDGFAACRRLRADGVWTPRADADRAATRWRTGSAASTGARPTT